MIESIARSGEAKPATAKTETHFDRLDAAICPEVDRRRVGASNRGPTEQCFLGFALDQQERAQEHVINLRGPQPAVLRFDKLLSKVRAAQVDSVFVRSARATGNIAKPAKLSEAGPGAPMRREDMSFMGGEH